MQGRKVCYFALGLVSFCKSLDIEAVTQLKTETSPYVRADNPLNHMRLDPKGRFVAYTGDDGLSLSVLNLKSKAIYLVSKAHIGGSFFWSPDGYRLFYRELIKTSPDSPTTSVIKAYDCALSQSVTLDQLPQPTGFLTFDPRDLRFAMLSPSGIRMKRIYFPDERLAKWQVAQRKETGKWLATQGGILWMTQGGLAMRQMEDDRSGVDSFDLSPDGQSIAWSTKSMKVYTSKIGEKPALIGYGRDPSWHPEKHLLVFSGARMVGSTPVSFDIRLADGKGSGKFLTATQYVDERWPQWQPSGSKILYTLAQTTDLFLLDFVP
jgi:hypothetical protein